MGLFNRDDGLEDGYRRAKNGETPDLVLNGIPQVRKTSGRESDNGISGRILNRVTGGQDEKFGDRDTRRQASAESLRDGEKQSMTNEKKADANTGGLSGARQSENNIASKTTNPGGFSSNVMGRKDDKKGRGKFSFNNIMRKMMPAIIAGSGIAGYGALSFMGQMAMPFSLVSQFQGNFDSIGASSRLRSSMFIKYQANPSSRTGLSSDVKDFVNQHSKMYKVFTGNDNDYFKISERQKKKFAKAGITVETDDSTGQSVLKFKQSNGVEMTVVPDESMTGDGRVYIGDYFQNNDEFHNAYFAGARTWRGAVGAWYDKVADKFLHFFGVKRGVWAAYLEGGASDENMQKFRTTVEDNASDSGGIKGSAETAEFEEKTDGDTQETTRTQTGEGSDSLDASKGSTREEISKNASKFINSKVTKLLSAAGAVSGLACMAADVVGAINLIVMAYQTVQIIKVSSSILEGIQKGQVEDSKTTPISEIGNSLTMRAKTTYTLTDVENTVDHSGGDGSDAAVATKDVTMDRSAMESSGISSLYGNKAVDYKDPSVQSFNIQNSVNGIAKAIGSSVTAYRACTFAKLGAAAVQGVVQLVEIIGCIASFGIGCLVDAFIEAGKSLAKEIAKAIIINVVVSAIVPFFANILTRKIATDVFGEDLGNALASGANIYMGQHHQYAGGSVASKESLTKFITEREAYNADIARYERTTRNPMDITSQYTFMGTLMNKFAIPMNIQAGGVVDKLSAFGNIVTKAVSSITPGATAVSAAITAQEAADATDANCSNIADIGGVADAFCNPYIITDVGTTGMDPADVTYMVSKLDSRNFDLSTTDTAAPVIKADSRLGHYILYCGQRQSPFGLADQNIANDFRTLTTHSTIGDTVISAIPVVGSLMDVYNGARVIANFGYVSGESCVTGNAVAVQETERDDGTTSVETSDWSENKYYQRFIEDQRLAENMGVVEKSSVTAFLEDYYKEHPIDDSYEGVLARRSGLTKDQVIATLDVMEAIAFSQNYNPDGYAPVLYEEPTPERISMEDIYQTNMDSGIISAIFHEDTTDERRIRNFAT